jgi:hypothetical protein
MTFTEEFENLELEELDQYPTAFGITFTPRNSGESPPVCSVYLAPSICFLTG